MNIVAPLSTPTRSTASPPYVARISLAILSTAFAICAALKTTSSVSPRRRAGSTIIFGISARSAARTNRRVGGFPPYFEHPPAGPSCKSSASAYPDRRGDRSVLAEQRHLSPLRERQARLAQESRQPDQTAPAR